MADLIEISTVNNDGDSADNLELLDKRIALFEKAYDIKKDGFTYTPVKYVNDAKRVLDDLHAISTTSAGDRIKKLAARKRFY